MTGELRADEDRTLVQRLEEASILPGLREMARPLVWCLGVTENLIVELGRACPNAAIVTIPLPRSDVPDRPDLLLEVGAFQELAAEQIEAYVRAAHAIGTPCLYSVTRLDRETGRRAPEVERAIASHYWPHEMRLLSPPSPKRRNAKASLDARHIVGWKRLLP